ncbi:MAG: hypothetical protein RIQ33_1096 [Bacteroidota bacterium]|jgi:predicted nuclease of predicted toxin-antitoxin system
MNFIIDAHLPFAIAELLIDNSLDAIHTRHLPNANETTDHEITKISLAENRIVISKDSDFYFTYLLHKKPYKLILIRVGNCSKSKLVEIFDSHLPSIIEALQTNGLIEVYEDSIEIIK